MLASSWPSKLLRGALMAVLSLDVMCRRARWPGGVERILGGNRIFLKILFSDFYIFNSYLLVLCCIRLLE
ncbi:hypothetical protein E0E52_09250 [Azotobacter chroococcum]|nr:hypothetical protein E0E52_09250 [Azotobacter chroococcum]